MKNKILIFVSLLTAFVLLFTACAPAATPAPAADKAVTVRVLTMQQAGATPEEMDAIAAEFNKANPNTKVEIEYVSYDALHDKIVTAMASTPPAYDVVLMDDPWTAEFAKAGYVKDVTSMITDDMNKKVFKAAWDVTSADGKVYGMPWLLDQKYFFYNEKILKEAGFDAPPTTWEEMVEQAKVMKEKNLVEYPIVWSWAQAEAAVCDWVVLLYGNGGSFLDDKGQPAFNNEKGVEVLTWMVNSIKDGTSNPASVSYVEEDVRNVFSQGKAAFALNWNYMFDMANASDKESKVTGQVKMAPIPAFKSAAAGGITSSSINGSMGFAIVSSSPNADAAWKYVTYLTSEDVQNRYSAHLLPIWQSSFEGEAGQKLESFSDTTKVTVPAFNAQFPTAHVRPHVAFYPEFSKNLQLALQLALTGQKTPKEALDEAAAKWVELAK
ncbi:MAG: extracellular solute-binding protein [Anaerolineae bacterium]|nr:extracellular solute-binding protein [Anaerolineae bacterium]